MPLRVSLALVLLLCVVSGCKRPTTATTTTTTARVDGRGARTSLVVGISQEPDTLFMPFKEMNAAEHIGRPGALMLTVFDERWQLLPQAAVSVPTVDNGGVVMAKDGTMHVTWKLKEGLAWADGVPVTSGDFVFGWQLCTDPGLEVVDRAGATRVQSMVAVDDRTFTVIWKEPYAYYAYYRNHEALPRHILEPQLRENKAMIKQSSYGTKPILGGAFTVSEWVPQSHITLVKNPHARLWKPQLDEITWKIIPQTQTIEAALLSGSVDVVSVIAFTFDQAVDFEKRHPEFDTVFTKALMIEHIDLNLDNPLLADKRVRQALVYALDREQLVRVLFNNKQPVAHSSEPDDNDDPGVPRYAFDPAKAKALLDEAGYVVGANGLREKDGKPLQFTIHSTAGDRLREQVEQLLVEWWRAVGVGVVVQNQPAKLLFGETIRHRKFDSMVMFTWTKEPNKVDETYWRCDQKPTEKNAFSGRNYPGFCSPEVDRLLDEAQRTLDDASRRALHRKIAAIIADEVPMIPLYDRVDVSVIPKDFKGWRPTGMLQSIAWNAWEWRWSDKNDVVTAPALPAPAPGAP
ncbi:MAG: peptide ABC transporter substrate-binding protein [Deltaproteobacteria bacterium]|nr:peptide ABC transporter substrate-binding protein [Deltaproteobacteria bacterium]